MLHLDLVGENDLCMWKGYRTIYTNKEFLIVAKFGTAINIYQSQAVCATDGEGVCCISDFPPAATVNLH